LSRPTFRDRSLALQSAVDACPAADTKQSLAHPELRRIDPKEFMIAEKDSISHLSPIETTAIALYNVLADGRRQVMRRPARSDFKR
jgi:hypothetical protein